MKQNIDTGKKNKNLTKIEFLNYVNKIERNKATDINSF